MQKDLIKVEIREGIPVVDARELWRKLEVKTDFRHWIKRRIKDYDFKEGKDFRSTLTETSKSGGRPAIEYLLTVSTAKELCMLENNEIGRSVRRYLIQIEDEHQKRKILASAPWTDYEKALIVQKALVLQQDMIKEMKPKADYFDLAMSSRDAFSIRDAAKIINKNMGQNKFFAWLRESKYLQKDNKPYQKYMTRGYFKLIEQSYTDKEGESHLTTKTLITHKGLVHMINKFNSGVPEIEGK